MADDHSMDDQSELRDRAGARRKLLDEEIEGTLHMEDRYDQIHDLIAINTLKILVKEEVSAAELKAAMDFLKSVDYKAPSMEGSDKALGGPGAKLQSLVDLSKIPVESLRDHPAA